MIRPSGDQTNENTYTGAHHGLKASGNGFGPVKDTPEFAAGILFETSPTTSWTDGLKAMYYRELTLEDMLG